MFRVSSLPDLMRLRSSKGLLNEFFAEMVYCQNPDLIDFTEDIEEERVH
jgi:hypothetical protein